MARKRERTVDWGGLDLIVRSITTGLTKANPYNLDDEPAVGEVSGRSNIVSVTTAARTVTAQESGTKFLLNKADGITFTLPSATAANVGLWYDFQIMTVITSSAAKWSTGVQGTDFFNGSFVGMDEDGTVTSGVVFTGDGATHDNISMNGTTTGGRLGTQFRLTCTAANRWTVSGMMGGNGAIATPFATT